MKTLKAAGHLVRKAAIRGVRWTSRKIVGLEHVVVPVENRLTHVEGAMTALETKLRQLEQVAAAMDAAIASKREETQRRVDDVDARLQRLTELGRADQETNIRVHQELRSRDEDAVRWLENLTRHLESVRREVLYEIRYSREEEEREVTPIVVDEARYKAKVAQMPEGLRVNLGAGVTRPDGALSQINVDMRGVDGVDIQADVRALPFKDGELAELGSAHLIEHFPDWEMRNRIMPYWYRLLKPGGILKVVCPDAEAMIRRYAAGNFNYEALREVTFGGQEYKGNQHYNMFTPDSLAELLKTVGFSEVTRVAVGRPNGQCLEMELHAIKA